MRTVEAIYATEKLGRQLETMVREPGDLPVLIHVRLMPSGHE